MVTRDKNDGEQTDLLHLEKYLCSSTNVALKTCLQDDCIAIEKTLYPTRGGISLRTYNKDKPAKYGLNSRSLGSSRHPYIYIILCHIPESQQT